MEKLQRCGYPSEEKFDDMFSRVDTIIACDGQTDGQTVCDSIDHAIDAHRAVVKLYNNRSKSSLEKW